MEGHNMLKNLFKTDVAKATKVFKKAMTLAKKNGFTGFGGHCGQAAIAMNQVLFGHTQQYVGVFNKALAVHGYSIGHIALNLETEVGTVVLDVDGIKSLEDIEHWGMLDATDQSIVDLFEQFDLTITNEACDETESCSLSEGYILYNFDCSQIKEQSEILKKSCQTVLTMNQLCLV